MRTRAATYVVLSSLLWAWPVVAGAQELKTFTTDADFALGTLQGARAAAPDSNQVRIDTGASVPPFIWSTISELGLVTKMDTRTGRLVARYDSVLKVNWDGTVPAVRPERGTCNHPLPTAVDARGDAFVVNRTACTDDTPSITKYAGSLESCVDRNGNGIIDTSSDVNGDGSILVSNAAEFQGQNDECILWTKNFAVAGEQGRALVVDSEQNVWASSFNTPVLYKLDGQTGAVLKTIDLVAETGVTSNIQGLAIGPGGFLYTSDGGAQRHIRKINPSAAPGSHVVGTLTPPVSTFGLAVDRNGVVWLGADSDSASGVLRADFSAGTVQMAGAGGCSGRTRGVAVDASGDIWAACWSSNRLLRISSSGTFKAIWSLSTRPEGVAVAADGRIWVTISAQGTLALINPAVTGSARIFHVGGMPYTYGDMTGYEHHHSILRRGSWSVVHDGGTAGMNWGTVTWNQEPEGATPSGSSITVAVRAAATPEGLSSQAFATITNGQPFTGISGRFIEVKATLRATNFSGEPVLSDLTIAGGNEPPVALCQNQDVCAGPTCTAQVSVDDGSYDPDGDPVSLAQSPAGPYGIGSRGVSLTVSDSFESASCSASVTVRDCEPPEITCAAPVQAECTGNQSATVSPGGADATDACSAVGVSGPGLASYPLGSTTVTYTAADLAGNTASCTTRVEVTDTLPPSITCPAPTTAECVGGGASNSGVGQASASDVCAPVTVQSPGLASFPLGTVSLSWSAADTSGNTVSCSAPFTVADRQAPALTLNGPASQLLECGSTYNEPGATATDACEGDLTAQVVISGAVAPGTPGSYTRSYDVTDPSGNDAPTVTRTVTVEDTLAPTLVLQGAATETLECGSAWVDPGAAASDLCAGDLTAAVVATGTVHGGQPGSYTRSYDVTDPWGNDAPTVTRTVTVEDTLAPVIVLIGPASQSLECGSTWSDLGATASDLCAGDLTAAVVATGTVNPAVPGHYTRSYRVEDPTGNTSPEVHRAVEVTDTQVPSLALIGPAALTLDCATPFNDPGATATDTCYGDLGSRITVSGAVDTSHAGSYVLTYGVADPSGNAAAPVSRTVEVRDTEGPVLSLQGANPLPLECMRDWYSEPGATAVDGCAGDISNSITIEHPYINSAVPGAYPVTYRAADSGGNVSTATREVRVQDTLPPNLQLNGASTLLLECKVDSFVDEGAVASDLCTGSLSESIVVTGTVDPNTPGAWPVRYRVQDSQGLVSEKVRDVRVVDTRPPKIVLEGSSAPVVECSRDGVVVQGATATDLCSGDVTHRITVSGTQDIVAPGTYPITYNVTDLAGNAAESVTRNITVKDTQGPVVTIRGEATMVLECGVDTYTELGATAYDACQGDLTGQIQTYGNGANPAAVGTYSIEYGVWDAAGNTTKALRTVKVMDRLPPVLTLLGPTTMHHECASGAFTDPGATAQDACYGNLTNSIRKSGWVNPWVRGTYLLNYSVQDSASLLATSTTRTVQVADTQAPSLTYREITVSPADQAMRNFSLADCVTASDVCDGSANANNGNIVSIYSDEPEDAPGTDDGATVGDIVITNKSAFKLRAERQASGNGRVYGVNFELKDQAGNVRVGLCRIRVPATQGGTAVDDGAGAGYTVLPPPPQTLASRTAR